MPIMEGICGVCRQSLAGDALAACTRCGASYHPDCWRYNGRRCAVYACTPSRGISRVRRGRGLSRADTVMALVAVGILVLLVLLALQTFLP